MGGYESKVGPYHGTPSAWHARATLSRTTSLLTTNTASNRCAIPATHAPRPAARGRYR